MLVTVYLCSIISVFVPLVAYARRVCAPDQYQQSVYGHEYHITPAAAAVGYSYSQFVTRSNVYTDFLGQKSAIVQTVFKDGSWFRNITFIDDAFKALTLCNTIIYCCY